MAIVPARTAGKGPPFAVPARTAGRGASLRRAISISLRFISIFGLRPIPQTLFSAAVVPARTAGKGFGVHGSACVKTVSGIGRRFRKAGACRRFRI